MKKGLLRATGIVGLAVASWIVPSAYRLSPGWKDKVLPGGASLEDLIRAITMNLHSEGIGHE